MSEYRLVDFVEAAHIIDKGGWCMPKCGCRVFRLNGRRDLQSIFEGNMRDPETDELNIDECVPPDDGVPDQWHYDSFGHWAFREKWYVVKEPEVTNA